MDKYLIEDKLYQLQYQLNERKNNNRGFYSALHDNIHSFHDGSGTTYI